MKLVSRSEWGAAAPRERMLLRAGDVRGVAVHYSAMAADAEADHRRCAARVRGIQRYHLEQNGWADIAYNHCLCCHGYVFEGRGFGVRSAANGTNAANGGYFAVCFLGADRAGRDDVTPAGRRALAQLILEYRRRYPRALRVEPHSAFFATACPGDELRRLIRRGAWEELSGSKSAARASRRARPERRPRPARKEPR